MTVHHERQPRGPGADRAFHHEDGNAEGRDGGKQYRNVLPHEGLDRILAYASPRYTTANFSHTIGALRLNSRPRRWHSRPKDAVWPRCQ